MFVTSFADEDVIDVDKYPPLEAEAELAVAQVAQSIQE